ncbi:hypothetical protein [Bradyrhizobium sp. CCGE-LA001]|uniref:hypothetical protein n=1 Tax=Bradyrhizobium sp. CCGE-LA001 TaxID=1223566 RepID=UPI000745CAF0|nr:hypothetical protein [Bradyrhizobium sp. CCGE-LA001]AMA59862.1 hypothetical protein BCCGELA001_28780 [Bradyrhizobium sp. CCGE-LA001]
MDVNALCLGGLLISGVATVGWCAANSKYRVAVDGTVKPLLVPERRWRYSAQDLQEFRRAALKSQTRFGISALEVYRERVLVIDCAFAIALGAFSLICWTLASRTIDLPFMGWLSLVCGFGSVAYGVFDVGEDVVLRMLLTPSLEISKDKVDRAVVFTRLKIAMICLSLVALLIWGLLGLIDKFALLGRREVQE